MGKNVGWVGRKLIESVKPVVRVLWHISQLITVVIGVVLLPVGKRKRKPTQNSTVLFVEKSTKLQYFITTQEKPVVESAIVNSELVYNIGVRKVPLYYANGVLVHNCDAISSAYSLLAKSIGIRTGRVKF